MIYFILVLLIIGSMFFSSLETALMALGDIKIKNWARTRIEDLKFWIEEPGSVITGILVGNNVVNIIFTTLFTLVVVKATKLWEIPHSYTEIISIVGSSIIILAFGEIIPKTFANTYPDTIVIIFYRTFVKFLKLVKWPVKILNKVSAFLAGGLNSKKEQSVSRDELDIYLRDIKKSDIFRREDSRMLGKVLFLTRTLVKEVMTSKKKIKAINLNWRYSRILEELVNSPYSRVPAYKNTLDDIKGIIYIKDVIGQLNRGKKIDFNEIMREPYIVSGNTNCHHLFKALRKERVHIAIVKIRKRLAGLITIEDLIEEIVGEIYDEYDSNTNN